MIVTTTLHRNDSTCRHSFAENQAALQTMEAKFPRDMVGRVLFAIYNLHHDTDTVYTLDKEAKELFESIFDKFNGQYNLKYSGRYIWLLFLYKLFFRTPNTGNGNKCTHTVIYVYIRWH